MNLADMQIDETSFAHRDMIGQDARHSFTPVFTGLTVVGATNYSGRYRFVGIQCFFDAQVSAATSIESVAGTTYMNLPSSAKGFGGVVRMYDATTKNEVGGGVIDSDNSRAYLPLQPASSDVFVISGWYYR